MTTVGLPGRTGRAAGHRGIRDGCDCPEGIVRCAHLNGMVVWLGDRDQTKGHVGVSNNGLARYLVVGPNIPEPCMCSSDHTVMPAEEMVTRLRTDSLAEAEAEFERRCALLRAEP